MQRWVSSLWLEAYNLHVEDKWNRYNIVMGDHQDVYPPRPHFDGLQCIITVISGFCVEEHCCIEQWQMYFIFKCGQIFSWEKLTLDFPMIAQGLIC